MESILKIIKFPLLLIISFIISFIAVLIGDMFCYNQGGLIFLVNSLTILFMLIYIKLCLNKSNDIFDFGTLFGIFFLMYNSVLLLNISISLMINKSLEFDIYPYQFSIITYLKACFGSFIASIGLVIGELIVFSKNNNKEKKSIMISVNENNTYFLIGFISFIIGLILFFFDFQRIGGFLNAISMDRVLRSNLLSETRGNLPYYGFILSGISIMTYTIREYSLKNKKCIMIISLLVLWILLMVIQGDRRFLLYSILIFASVYFSYKKVNIKKYLFVLFIIYMSFSFFQHIRYLIPLLINKNIGISDVISIIQSELDINWFLPIKNELAGPYFSLLWYLDNKFSYLYGYSYLMAIPNILPRSIYPGVKPPTIGQTFAINIHDQYYSLNDGITGWGFNPVAEAYINFGFIGILFIFILYSLLFKYIRLRKYKEKGIIINSVIIPEAFNINRIDFSSIVQELAINLLILIFVLFTAKVMSSIINRIK